MGVGYVSIRRQAPDSFRFLGSLSGYLAAEN